MGRRTRLFWIHHWFDRRALYAVWHAMLNLLYQLLSPPPPLPLSWDEDHCHEFPELPVKKATSISQASPTYSLSPAPWSFRYRNLTLLPLGDRNRR